LLPLTSIKSYSAIIQVRVEIPLFPLTSIKSYSAMLHVGVEMLSFLLRFLNP
jgi:hypothetical protein